MIEVHHLKESRSRRITWMLEELGQEYAVISYDRDPQTRLAPPVLASTVIRSQSDTLSGDQIVTMRNINADGGKRTTPALPNSAKMQRHPQA
jgi:hypothetical protein